MPTHNVRLAPAGRAAETGRGASARRSVITNANLRHPACVHRTGDLDGGIQPRSNRAARELVADLGGELRDFYVTMGQYDGIAIADFPDDETATEYALILGKAGNARTETLRAFTEPEFEGIVEDIS